MIGNEGNRRTPARSRKLRGRSGTRTLRIFGFIVLGGAGFSGLSCNFSAIEKCHTEMKSSQQAMLDMDSSDVAEVEKTLVAVEATLASCKKAGRDEEVSKIADAQRKLKAQATALKERAERKKRPKLSEIELKSLMRKGDPSCPKGQEYEHHQNKKRIRCTGKQLIDMTSVQATTYFENRGYKKSQEGPRLRLEHGVRVYDFFYKSPASDAPPYCLVVVAQPGASWQETVTRATSVHPRKLALGKSVPTKRGALSLLVEGNHEQYTVKLGECEATPGQKPVLAPVGAGE